MSPASTFLLAVALLVGGATTILLWLMAAIERLTS